MTEFESNIDRGILSGVKIDEETVETVSELAEKLEELDNGVIDPEEETIATLMGAEAKPKDAVNADDILPEGAGAQVADHGVLTGATVDQEMAEELADVAETIENLTEYEKSVNGGSAAREDTPINDLGETLAVLMGVEPEAKKPGEK